MDKFHKILIQVDEKDHWEFPPKSAKGTSYSELEEIKVLLDEIFEISLDFDKNVQDASFLTNIGELDDRYYNRKTKSGAVVYKYAFRFSNFGRLYTVIGNHNKDQGITLKIEKAKNFLEQKGFVYIPLEILNVKYDGVNEPFEKGLTWWTRYFDYL